MTARLRPCGACGALVDALIGCEHWKVKALSMTASAIKSRRIRAEVEARRQQGREAAAELRHVMTGAYR